MGGLYSSRKHWLLVSLLLLSGSVAGFSLGQQVGHSRLQPARRTSVQSTSIAGAIGGRAVTTAPSMRTHATTVIPPRTPAPPDAWKPTPGSGEPASGHDSHGHGHGDGHEHKHGRKDDDHPKADHYKSHEDNRHAETSAQPGDSQSAQLRDGKHTPGAR